MKKRKIFSTALLMVWGLIIWSGILTAQEHPIVVSIETAQTVYMVGQPIEIFISATNMSDEDYTMVFFCSQYINYQIDDFFDYFVDMNVYAIMVITYVNVPANETLTWTRTHLAEYYYLEPGEYTITGLITNTLGDVYYQPASTTIIVQNENTNDVIISVSTDKDIYLENEPIPITISAINPTDEAITLYFDTSLHTNYLIGDEFNYVIDMMIACLPYLNTITIEPNSYYDWEEVHLPEYYHLSPGVYTITGIVLGYGDDSTTITVVEEHQVEEESIVENKYNGFTLRNYPNPFNPDTTILFQLPKEGRVRITIYNSRGQLVNHLADKYYSKGEHSIVWDGKDFQDKVVPSGVYFSRLVHQNRVMMNKLLLLQ